MTKTVPSRQKIVMGEIPVWSPFVGFFHVKPEWIRDGAGALVVGVTRREGTR